MTCTNLGKKILPIVLPAMVEAENFSEHPHMYICVTFISVICIIPHVDCCEIVVCWIEVISIL